MIGRYGKPMLDILFPRKCLVCLTALQTVGGELCPVCSKRLDDEQDEPSCPMCAGSVAPYEISNGQCSTCRRSPSRLRGTVRVGPYATVLGGLIRGYKFAGHTENEPFLSKKLVKTVVDAPWLDRVEAIVSVPTHWRHRLTRPLYAAEVLAAAAARGTGLAHLPILKRIRAGQHQVGLSYQRRKQNVQGAFAMRRGVTLNHARLLLVDDVKTTGATIEECAKILRRAGASEVYAAIVVKVAWDRASVANLAT